jgi:hypothetical protein
MALRNFSSTAAETTLSVGIDSSTTSMTVGATTGFPAVPFILAVDAGAAAQELVLVTNVAGNILTVTRGYDSTTAVAHVTGAVIQHSHAGLDFREANTHVNAESGVHGATGDVVGTSDTQTLTNKTLALGSNTVSGTKAQFNTALSDGDFATLDGTETLTNKTLTAPAATGSLASFGEGWTTYVPAFTNLGTPTVNYAKYTQVGRTVRGRVIFTLAAAPTGIFTIGLPVAAAAALGTGRHVVVGQAVGLRTAVAYEGGFATLGSTTTVNIGALTSSMAQWNATTPQTWASGDIFSVTFEYEAA